MPEPGKIRITLVKAVERLRYLVPGTVVVPEHHAAAGRQERQRLERIVHDVVIGVRAVDKEEVNGSDVG